MPLSPSREAVHAAMNAASRPSFSDDAAVMLAAAYAIDLAPLVALCERAVTFVHDVGEFRCVRAQEEGDLPFNIVDYHEIERLESDLRAVLARSQEPHKETR